VKETTDVGTGTDEEIMYQHYKKTYSHRYSNFGNLDDLHPCIEYLQEKPKFLSWRVKMNKLEKGDKKPRKKTTKPCSWRMFLPLLSESGLRRSSARSFLSLA
jgi:hypothetical protein